MLEKVSVIMPAYNAAEFIEDSIRSVQEQTYQQWELLVIDDGSIDHTAEVVKKLAENDERIIYIYQENQKLGAARNRGLQAAKGDWIAFLDSDDLWMPQKLEKQLEASKTQKVDVVFTGGQVLYHEKGTLDIYNTINGKYEGAELYKLLLFNNAIPILSVILKRDIINKVGLQETDLRAYGCEDWDYWLRISKNRFNFYGLNEPLFKYRIHENGMSRNILRMEMSECYVIYKNLDFSLLSTKEADQIKISLTYRAKTIISKLYNPFDPEKISYFLNIVDQVKGGHAIRLAKVLNTSLKKHAKTIILLLLSNFKKFV